MTDYEAKLVKEYESNGLEFLCVVSGGDSIDLNIEVAHEYGIPVKEVFRVQGDCMGYDTKYDLWNSHWLMFRYRGWQALCGNSLESSFAMQTGGIEMEFVSKEDVRTAFDNADADVMADYGPEYGCEWGFSRDAVNRILDSVGASVEHFTPGQEVWIAELDKDGHVLRIFESINDMAASLNTSTATAGLWIRQGDIRATGCKYAVCEGEGAANEAR